MDYHSSWELNSIKEELRSIISEVDSIANGVDNSFKNIGNDRCANSIRSMASLYRSALSRLENINTSNLTQEFLDRQNSST